MNNVLRYILHLIFLFGIYGAGSLAIQEFSYDPICPRILGIPACYIILTCLVIPFISHLFKRSNTVYFIGTGLAWTIATYGSIMQIMGYIECPKTSGETPLCFISFGVFSTLILLKVIELHKTNT